MDETIKAIAEPVLSQAKDAVWGDIPRVPHIQTKMKLVPDAKGPEWEIQIDVIVSPFATCPIPHLAPVQHRGGIVRGRCRLQFGKYRDTLCHRDVETLIAATVRSTVMDIEPLLREVDPRIGITIKAGWLDPIQPFPRGLLFDPPRMRLPASGSYDTRSDAVPCAFCHRKFKIDEDAMWAGGNLFWVHLDCWTQIQQT